MFSASASDMGSWLLIGCRGFVCGWIGGESYYLGLSASGLLDLSFVAKDLRSTYVS